MKSVKMMQVETVLKHIDNKYYLKRDILIECKVVVEKCLKTDMEAEISTQPLIGALIQNLKTEFRLRII